MMHFVLKKIKASINCPCIVEFAFWFQNLQHYYLAYSILPTCSDSFGYVNYPLNLHDRVHYPWKEDLQSPAAQNAAPTTIDCGAFATRFGKRRSIPPIALASRPGAGNTWVRYLLQGATGIFTGDVYFVSHNNINYIAGAWSKSARKISDFNVLM